MLIIYDFFKKYLEKLVKKKFKEYNYNLAIISDGLINIYQPLNVAINKLFKDNLRKE